MTNLGSDGQFQLLPSWLTLLWWIEILGPAYAAPVFIKSPPQEAGKCNNENHEQSIQVTAGATSATFVQKSPELPWPTTASLQACIEEGIFTLKWQVALSLRCTWGGLLSARLHVLERGGGRGVLPAFLLSRIPMMGCHSSVGGGRGCIIMGWDPYRIPPVCVCLCVLMCVRAHACCAELLCLLFSIWVFELKLFIRELISLVLFCDRQSNCRLNVTGKYKLLTPAVHLQKPRLRRTVLLLSAWHECLY